MVRAGGGAVGAVEAEGLGTHWKPKTLARAARVVGSVGGWRGGVRAVGAVGTHWKRF